MAQPRSYSITTNFNDYTTTNPSDPHPGSKLDTEFTEIKQNLDDLNTNIALLQRDDGKLKNEAVHKDGFDQDSLALIGLSGYTTKGTWAAATAYKSGDIVTNNDATYLTSTDHTSSSAFNDDLATSWTLIANAAINVTGHSVDTLNGHGTIVIQNANWTNGTATITYSGGTNTGNIATGQHVEHADFPKGTTITNISGTTLTVSAAPTASQTDVTVNLDRSFTLSYSYGDEKAFQVFISGVLTSPSLYTVSGTTITFTNPPAAGTGNIIVWGGGTAVEDTKAQVTSYRDDTLDHRDTAADYATRTTGVVRHFDGATNNVTDTTPTDQSGVYSAKEWAVGEQASTGGSAKDWAIYTDGGVRGETGEHSSKAWAVGGTGVTDTADKGAAKEWAIGTGRIDDQSSGGYSAKEHATGTTNAEGSAKQWALGGGSFVEATAVEGSNYSAKKYASDASASATAAATSETNAATSETNAATSATAAAASYDSFDDRYLGAKSSDPTVDNDGDTLVDGALYFNDVNNVMMVYDLGNTTWVRTTPTTTDQGHINTVSASIDDVNRYANEYKIAATAPGSPSEGHMWSDTTNNVFKVYNGTSWATVTEGQTAAEVNGTAISMAIALG